MTGHSWMTWVWLAAFMWIYLTVGENQQTIKPYHQGQRKFSVENQETINSVFKDGGKFLVVADNFYGFINATNWSYTGNDRIIFLQKNASRQKNVTEWWPQIDPHRLYISEKQTRKDWWMYALYGKNCSKANLTESKCVFNHTVTGAKSSAGDPGPCQIRCVQTNQVCKGSTYDENICSDICPQFQDRYLINITSTITNCVKCDRPVKSPVEKIHLKDMLPTGDMGKVDAAKASKVITEASNLVANMTGSSAALYVGEGVTGIIYRETEPEEVDEVDFAYMSPNDSMNIIDDKAYLAAFERTLSIPKEAFEKSISSNISIPFVTVLRFTNLAQDEANSTLLGDEVLAVDMGATIANLTDTVDINFKNVSYKGIPSCQSWNGEGRKPNWTDDGCVTIQDGDKIKCQCSHLTFFAILLAPPNVTIPSSDLNTLSIITQVGCGLSMFFLSIILFMHFLIRRTKASEATQILIQLVSAMFLLNFTFLINNFVAKLKNAAGCKTMAALMHYFMLATFTWFAIQAFHLCLQMYKGSYILTRRYVLKISIVSWILPSVVAVALLIAGKYGEQVIHTDNSEDVTMCWMTDHDAHYIVNIGYYALVFIFTFTVFIIILSWLICLKRTKAPTAQESRHGRSITVILGLCCMLGITWGFAFFAFGAFQIPAYYIFTILNSFQGFFLFIYYYHNTSNFGKITAGENDHTNSSSSTTTTTGIETNPKIIENPFYTPGQK